MKQAVSLDVRDKILIYQMHVLGQNTKEEIISPGYVSLAKKRTVNCDSPVS